MKRSTLNEMREVARNVRSTSVEQMFQLWDQMKQEKDPKELIRGFNCVFYYLVECGEFQQALRFIEELEGIADVLQVPSSTVKEWKLTKRAELLLKTKQYSELWHELHSAPYMGISTDLIWHTMEVLVRCGYSEQAFLGYQAYVSGIEIEIFLWEIRVKEMDFPNTFAIPVFVRELFRRGTDEQREQVVNVLLRLVNAYLRTRALAVFAPYEEEATFLGEVANWLQSRGQDEDASRIQECLKLLRQQWLQDSSSSEWRRWLRRPVVEVKNFQH